MLQNKGFAALRVYFSVGNLLEQTLEENSNETVPIKCTCQDSTEITTRFTPSPFGLLTRYLVLIPIVLK